MNKSLKKVSIFILLTFGISWSIIGIFVALGGEWRSPYALPIAVIYMYIPTVSVIIIHKLIFKEPIKKLGISFNFNKWFIVAWFLPILISLGSIGISIIFPDVSFSPQLRGFLERIQHSLPPEEFEEVKQTLQKILPYLFWISLAQGIIAGISINAVVGFGEELGWRGFLLKELSPYGFWKSSLLIGVIWGVWHTPIILLGHNYPQHPKIGVLIMVIFCVLYSPIFSYITKKAKSVIAAAILHGTINGTAGISIMLLKGGNDLTIGITGAAGLITLLMVDVALYIYFNKLTF